MIRLSWSFDYIYIRKQLVTMAPHSSTLAWQIPWTEVPGRLQSMASLGVGHDWATSLSLFTFMHWRRKWQPTQCSCLENPRDGGAWWAVVYGVTQSRIRLKWLSSSSNCVTWNKFKNPFPELYFLYFFWINLFFMLEGTYLYNYWVWCIIYFYHIHIFIDK